MMQPIYRAILYGMTLVATTLPEAWSLPCTCDSATSAPSHCHWHDACCVTGACPRCAECKATPPVPAPRPVPL